ncbi:MAG TPA: glycosyltransferase family 4 protein [Gemmatimonadales bacterium]|jgi:glycosyltransferase involved in cell wall biosynthesis|nr:glycosyltransferase family 4 protein [Gemmatimonadales bacterium]
MRILLSAYACAPHVGSEPGIGWGVALELAKRHTVWVLTRANNRPEHERAFSETPRPMNLHFIYYDLPGWLSFWKRGARGWRLYYWLWQLGSVRTVRRLLRSEEIDLCQHITIGMDYMPSGLALIHKPFLWGPVGSENIHPDIHSSLPLGERMGEWRRILLRFLARYCDPFVWLTRARADLILCFTSTESRARSFYLRSAPKVIPVVQTGLEIGTGRAPAEPAAPPQPFTVVFAGRLVHWKGALLAAEAFAVFASRVKGARLLVIGEGPLRGAMEQTFRTAAVEDRVEFTGTVPPEILMQRLRTSDVFLYPAFRHGLATVCLQAMASGLPVVCLRDGPIGEAVGSECGVTIPVTAPELPAALGAALALLHDDPEHRARLAQNAIARIQRDYSYQAVVQRWEPLYEKVVMKPLGSTA